MSLWTKNGETKEKLSKRVQRRETGYEREGERNEYESNIEESGKYGISCRAEGKILCQQSV